MRRILLAMILAAGVLATALPATAGVTAPQALNPADARGVAIAALHEHVDDLAVDAGAFRMDSVRTSVLGTHVRGREVRGGVPVAGTSAAVWIRDGEVLQVVAQGSGGVPGQPASRAISSRAAVAAALQALDVNTAFRTPSVQRLLVERAGRLVDVYRVGVLSLKPAVAATVDISAADGRVVSVSDARVLVDGSATVFDPNPIQSTGNADLRQPGVDFNGVDTDLDSAELTAALVTLPLPDLDATALARGKLQGPYVDVIASVPSPSLDGKFTFTRGLPQFEATMAYAHIDRAQRYFQELGFTDDAAINAEPQDVVALPVLGFDNSFYMPAYDLLLFGAGGVDDGEDAEVILHEYGHAVHDAQVPGWGNTHEGGAMGEGFGDFLAAAYYARTSGGFGDECVMDWDATSYSNADPPCLRRVDTTKRYPADMANSVHADGEIWSAFLWRVRDRLGADAVTKSDNALRLLLASHELLTPDAEFADAVAALRSAAAVLGPEDGEWVRIVEEEATVTGFPLEP